MRLFRLLTLRQVWHDPRRLVMIAAAIGAGVSLAVMTFAVTESIDRSAGEFGSGIVGDATLRVEGAVERGGLTEDSVRVIEQTPGVQGVVPVVRALTYVDPPSADHEPIRVIALGVDCRVELLIGDVGCAPELLEALGTRPLGLGPNLAARSAGATIRSDAGRLTLGQPVALPAPDGVVAGSVVLFGLPAAQELFVRHDRFDLAYVVPEDGSDATGLRAALENRLGPRYTVLAADAPPAALELATSMFMPLFGLLSLFGLVIGAVLVRNIVALALAERRQYLAVMLSIGSDRRTLAAATSAEVGILGLAGGVVGVVAGAALAFPVTATLSPVIESTLGMPLTTHIPLTVTVVGIAIGIAVALLAAIFPIREVVRLDPAATLSERQQQSAAAPASLGRRVATWALVAAAGVAGCWAISLGGGLESWQVRLGPVAFVAAALGTILLIGSVGPIGAAAFASRLSRVGASVARMLSVGEFRRDPRRTGVMMSAIAAAVIVAVVADGMERSTRFAVESGTSAQPGVYVFIGQAADPDVETTALLGDDTIAALSALPPAADVVQEYLLVAGGPGMEIAVQASDDPQLAERVLRGTADRERLEAGEVLVGPGLARRLDIRPGQELPLPTPTGTVTVKVQGVWEDGRYGGNNVTVPRWLMDDIYDPQPPVTVTVRPAPGVGEAELAEAINAAGVDPQLNAMPRQVYLQQRAEQVVEQIAPFRVMQYALLLLAFVAVVSTLLLAARQRRREHATLLALGARTGDLVRLFLLQGAVIAGVAVILAAGAGPLLQWALQQVLPLVAGFRQPFHLDVAALAFAGPLVLLVSLAATLWPARDARRVHVIETLRSE